MLEGPLSDKVSTHIPLTTVSVKLPTEAQFENKRITSSRMRFTHCVATLHQDYACRLLDLVRAPRLNHMKL